MNRRRFLLGLAGSGLAGFAGCLTGENPEMPGGPIGGGTDTPTPTPTDGGTATPTDPGGGGGNKVEFEVETGHDLEAFRVEVSASAAGKVRVFMEHPVSSSESSVTFEADEGDTTFEMTPSEVAYTFDGPTDFYPAGGYEGVVEPAPDSAVEIDSATVTASHSGGWEATYDHARTAVFTAYPDSMAVYRKAYFNRKSQIEDDENRLAERIYANGNLVWQEEHTGFDFTLEGTVDDFVSELSEGDDVFYELEELKGGVRLDRLEVRGDTPDNLV
ncbi:MAG: hypothetical protein ACOCTH_00365 [Halodesulfurarchaeum sp.]